MDKLPSGETWWKLESRLIQCEREHQGELKHQGQHLNVVKLQHINAEERAERAERAERKFVLHGTECGLGVGGTQKIIIDQRNGEGQQRIDDRIENGKNEKSGTSKEIAINGGSNNNERDKKLELLITFILSKIDDLMSLYTETMKKHAEEIFIQEMKIFITDKCISKIFTLGKVRTIMNWLNGNKITKTSLYVIVQFVNWFLDINLVELKYVKNDLYIIQ